MFRSALVDAALFDPFFVPIHVRNVPALMSTDIRRKDGAYKIEMELPGFAKEDVDISLKEGTLAVSVERKEEEKDKDYLVKERRTGRFTRSFFVGKDVKEEDIHAKFRDGVLTITVPEKKEKMKEEKKIAIDG